MLVFGIISCFFHIYSLFFFQLTSEINDPKVPFLNESLSRFVVAALAMTYAPAFCFFCRQIAVNQSHQVTVNQFVQKLNSTPVDSKSKVLTLVHVTVLQFEFSNIVILPLLGVAAICLVSYEFTSSYRLSVKRTVAQRTNRTCISRQLLGEHSKRYQERQHLQKAIFMRISKTGTHPP